MKLCLKILFFVLLSISSFGQNFNWITPNKTYLKLYIADDGIYRINRSDFTQAGINTSNIDPRTVKVFYKGTEIPIYFEGEQDGTFDDADYIDFYGTRNYGGLTNTYSDDNGQMNIRYVTNEYYNLYSDTSVYWIGWDGNNGLRMILSNFSTPNLYPENFHNEKIRFERDTYYDLGETVNPNQDFRHFNTEKVLGEGWYQQKLIAPNYTVTETFNSSNLIGSSQTCSIKLFAYPGSRDSSFNEHKLQVKINNTQIALLQKNDYDRFDTTLTFQSNLLNSGSTNTVTIIYQPTFGNQNATPILHYDFCEVQYPRKFNFDSSRAKIVLSGGDTTSKQFSLTGFNVANPVSIYDVKNGIKITNYSVDSDTLNFSGKSNASFEVINRVINKKPFRIISKQVPDLVSSSNGADYIIIYNRLFTNSAENLKQHRQVTDNFRSVKTDIEDIIDIFNYGMEDPLAIKRFLNLVYSTWQLPRIQYVCLLGRGSLDPKNNLNLTFHNNYIPVYGNPPSDGYLATFNFGGFTYYKQISVGRLPAYTQQEADIMVNKIISYDQQRTNPDEWWKKITMITGGPDRPQQIQYQNQSNNFVNSYLAPCPVASNIAKIYRNDSAGYVTFNYRDSIKHEFDRGSILVNFIGHAANQDWEVGLEDPNTLNNGYKLPLILSMTCFTGKNSEVNQRGFGEQFIYLNNKGAIGFVGSTGWSFASAGNILNQYMLQKFSQDSLRRIGDILKLADNELASDSISFSVKNMINCYDLLGDPAIRLLLPKDVEFTARQQDYRLSNPYPIVGENITFTIFPKNYGLCANNCPVQFELLRNGLTFNSKDTTIFNFKEYDTLRYQFRIDTIGNYSIRATLDYNNQFPNEINTNNVYLVPLPLRNISYTPLKPVNNSAIKTDTVEFVGLNPQLDLRTSSIRLLLQVDTNKNFTNPLLNYNTTNISGVVNRVNYHLPFLDTNLVYYWRTNSIINNDSTGWIATQHFTYNAQIGNLFDKSSYDSTVTIYIKKPGQLNIADIVNLNYNGSGFVLNNFTGNLQAHSFGSNSFQASYFIINNLQYYSDGGANTGLNVAKVSRLTGRALDIKNFRMNSPQSSDSVLTFLNTFDTTQFVMSYMAMYVPDTDSLKQTAKNKFKEFGSQQVDSVKRFDSFDSWAFIGYLGATVNDISEEFQSYPTKGCQDLWCPSNAMLNPVFLNTSGSLTFNIGPAHRWKYFSWDRFLNPNSFVNFDVYGLNRSDQQTQLLSNLSNNSLVQIDTMNYYTYPNLKLVSRVSIDTVTGLLSPVFKSLNFKYTPPAELVPDNSSVTRTDSVVQEGTSVTFSVRNYNVGYVTANAVINKWTAIGSGGFFTLKTDTVYTPLKQDSSQISSVTFSTTGLRDPKKSRDSLLIFFETEPLGNTNDFYYFNNFAQSSLVITGDSAGPSIEVTFDGQKIIDGDYVRKSPEVLFRFFDESKSSYTISDTANIRIKLDGSNIYYSLGGVLNPSINFNPVNNGNLKVEVRLIPELSEGEHRFQFIASDQNSHHDTANYIVNVSYALKISNLYNFPNPLRDFTTFTFMLSGEILPTACRIKIYTVAGRLIREIHSPARIGFNTINWDARDNDGEQMANGIYLYKIILEDGKNTESGIQKAAILR